MSTPADILTRFRGSFVALITPFTAADGGKSIDDEAFQKLVDWQIKEGTHGLVPCGTTGESPTLSHEEHDRLVALCVEASAGRVPVMAGAGSNSTAEAVRLTKHAAKAGADATLVVTPYYNKPTQEGLFDHFKAVAQASDLPLFIYNIPGRSIVNMSVETMGRLAEIPNVVGVKDATADLARASLQRTKIGPDFVQLSGEDATALGFMAHGGHGAISVTANIAPSLCAAFQSACLEERYSDALTIHDKLMPLHSALFCESSPGPAKYAAELLGLCGSIARLPITEIAPESKETVRQALTDVGLL